MNTTIYKYPLDPDTDIINLPRFANVLCVQVQGTTPCIWAEVDPNAPLERRHFQVVGTGHQLPVHDKYEVTEPKYIGTFQLHGGMLVFHLYEVSGLPQ